MILIWLNGWMVVASPLKSVTSIPMDNSAAVIAVLRELITCSTSTRLSAPSAVMFMVPMDLTCTKGDVPNVREALLASGTG